MTNRRPHNHTDNACSRLEHQIEPRICRSALRKRPPNTLMVLTNPGAAQGVLRPPCLLPGLAAHQHVGQTTMMSPARRVCDAPWS